MQGSSGDSTGRTRWNSMGRNCALEGQKGLQTDSMSLCVLSDYPNLVTMIGDVELIVKITLHTTNVFLYFHGLRLYGEKSISKPS